MKILFFASIITILFMAILTPQSNAGNLVVRENIHYYNVKGSTAKELKQYMKKWGPPFAGDKKSKRYWGYTIRKIRKLNNCSKIIVTNHIDIPKWINRKDTSLSLQHI